MNPISVDVKDLLVSENLGIFGTNLFVGREPTKPINCVTIYDTGHADQNARLALDESTIQVRCRNKKYIEAYNNLEKIKIYLEGKPETTINNVKYIGFWATTNIAFLQRNENDHCLWTVNFRIIREPQGSDKGHRQTT